MKKLTALLVAVILSLFFAGCTGPSKNGQSEDSGTLSVVCTIFPCFDFARQISEDSAEVLMLLPPGVESHSFEPTAQDIIKIQNCDLFIYTGGENDTWIEDILASLDAPVNALRMMDYVEIVEEEFTEGMEADESEQSHENEQREFDYHVWTSPKNVILIAEGIKDALCEAAPEYTDLFTENCAAYTALLTELDNDFTDFFSGVKNKTLIFGDRFPLRYFADAYGLDYYAAFPGCSANTEPSAATIAFLINKIKAENVGTVYYIEFSNHLAADSIAEATGANTALFHSCHNVSAQELASGATYVSLMRNNLEMLKGAMS
ncbi:MAG: zinc ABC transporter substrate-binding protein [Clostridiales bacterium]|nr:zinc ABC transporter substrate-binding protein [Clostridiales bacterium]